jgi:hypothetical protein
VLTLPNIESTPSFDAQSATDETDLLAAFAAQQGNYVLNGCQVTPFGGGMSVMIGSGTLLVNGQGYTVASGTVSITAASGGDRRDIIVYTVGTGFRAIAGVPCAVAGWVRGVPQLPPVKPAIPANSVLLGEVYVASSTVGISWSNIIDKTFVLTPLELGAGSIVYVNNYGGDPTDTVDSSPAFLAAFNALPTIAAVAWNFSTLTFVSYQKTVGKIRWGGGLYKVVNDLVNTGPGVIVEGVNQGGTVLDYWGSNFCAQCTNPYATGPDAYPDLVSAGYTLGPGASSLYDADQATPMGGWRDVRFDGRHCGQNSNSENLMGAIRWGGGNGWNIDVTITNFNQPVIGGAIGGLCISGWPTHEWGPFSSGGWTNQNEANRIKIFTRNVDIPCMFLGQSNNAQSFNGTFLDLEAYSNPGAPSLVIDGGANPYHSRLSVHGVIQSCPAITGITVAGNGTATASIPVTTGMLMSGYFNGMLISIPGAGHSGGNLNGIINGAVDGVAGFNLIPVTSLGTSTPTTTTSATSAVSNLAVIPKPPFCVDIRSSPAWGGTGGIPNGFLEIEVEATNNWMAKLTTSTALSPTIAAGTLTTFVISPSSGHYTTAGTAFTLSNDSSNTVWVAQAAIPGANILATNLTTLSVSVAGGSSLSPYVLNPGTISIDDTNGCHITNANGHMHFEDGTGGAWTGIRCTGALNSTSFTYTGSIVGDPNFNGGSYIFLENNYH